MQDLVWSPRGLGGMERGISNVTSKSSGWKETGMMCSHSSARTGQSVSFQSPPKPGDLQMWAQQEASGNEHRGSGVLCSRDDREEIASSNSTTLMQGFQM